MTHLISRRGHRVLLVMLTVALGLALAFGQAAAGSHQDAPAGSPEDPAATGLSTAEERAQGLQRASDRLAELAVDLEGVVGEPARERLAAVLGGIAGALTEGPPAEAQLREVMADLDEVVADLDQDASGEPAAKAAAAVLAVKAELESVLGDDHAAVIALEGAIARDAGNRDLYLQFAGTRREAGEEGVTAFVNGRRPEFDVPPFIQEGRTLVPLRAIGEALGAEVEWDADTRTVTMTRAGVTISLGIDDVTAAVEGATVELDVPATITNGRTVVPLRFIGEAFGALVDYIDGVVVVDD